MYVNCQGALAIEIWPGIFILKNLKVHQNQKNGAKQPNGYILSAYGLSASRHLSLTSEYMFNYIFSCLLSNLNFWYEHQKECSLEQVCNMSKQLVSEGMLKYIENMDI